MFSVFSWKSELGAGFFTNPPSFPKEELIFSKDKLVFSKEQLVIRKKKQLEELEVEWIGKENEVDWIGVEERKGDW